MCKIFFNSRRKWLPQPLRKLSQGKVDKTAPSATPASSSSSSATPSDRPFLKKGSEKAFKLAASVTAEEEQPLTQKTSMARLRDKGDPKSDHDHPTIQSGHAAEIENEEEVVLPPPMKPIQDSQAIINNGPTAAASSVAEQSPCKRVSILDTIDLGRVPNRPQDGGKIICWFVSIANIRIQFCYIFGDGQIQCIYRLYCKWS